MIDFTNPSPIPDTLFNTKYDFERKKNDTDLGSPPLWMEEQIDISDKILLEVSTLLFSRRKKDSRCMAFEHRRVIS